MASAISRRASAAVIRGEGLHSVEEGLVGEAGAGEPRPDGLGRHAVSRAEPNGRRDVHVLAVADVRPREVAPLDESPEPGLAPVVEVHDPPLGGGAGVGDRAVGLGGFGGVLEVDRHALVRGCLEVADDLRELLRRELELAGRVSLELPDLAELDPDRRGGGLAEASSVVEHRALLVARERLRPELEQVSAVGGALEERAVELLLGRAQLTPIAVGVGHVDRAGEGPSS